MFARLVLGLAGVCVVGLPAAAFADQEPPFESMDTNGDGKISPAEDAAVAARMFETMDANHDRKVSASEMATAYQKTTGAKAEQGATTAAEIMKIVDSNGDGVLSAGEHAALAKSVFATMDTNHDGYLSKAEVNSARAR
jgi:Ca2+-binding EF-hand superfamily protein